jgi:hypothetical protein
MSHPLEQFPSEQSSQILSVCRLLRTKTAYGNYGQDMDAWQMGDSTTAVFWCLSTMTTAGPDQDYAHPMSCRDGRRCFKAALE